MISLRAILGTCLIFLIRATRAERFFFRFIHRVFVSFLHTPSPLSLLLTRCTTRAELIAYGLKRIGKRGRKHGPHLFLLLRFLIVWRSGSVWSGRFCRRCDLCRFRGRFSARLLLRFLYLFLLEQAKFVDDRTVCILSLSFYTRAILKNRRKERREGDRKTERSIGTLGYLVRFEYTHLSLILRYINLTIA